MAHSPCHPSLWVDPKFYIAYSVLLSVNSLQMSEGTIVILLSLYKNAIKCCYASENNAKVNVQQLGPGAPVKRN